MQLGQRVKSILGEESVDAQAGKLGSEREHILWSTAPEQLTINDKQNEIYEHILF